MRNAAPAMPLLLLATALVARGAALAAQGAGPAVQAASGGKAAELHFRWAAGGRIVGRPLVGDGIVYFLSEDRAIYGIDDSPRVLFRSGGFSPKARYAPARGGSMLVADGDALVRLNRAGQEAWRFILNGAGGTRGFTVPVEGRDGRIVSAGTRLVCVSATGRLVWDRQLPFPARFGPLVDPEGDLVLCLEDGSVETWSAFGKRLWRLEAGGAVKDLILNRQRILVLREGGQALEVLGPQQDGKPSWGPPLSSDCLSACAALEAEPFAWYLLSSTGRLDAVDADGSRRWSLECGGGLDRVESQPGRAYLTGKGRVLSITRLGTPLRELTVTNASGEAVVSPTGIVYSGGMDWILYAYRFDVERQAGYGNAPSTASSGYGFLSGPASLDEWGGTDRRFLEPFLFDVEKSLKSGNMDDEAQALRFCAALALSRVMAPFGADAERRAAPLDLRARACAVLGASGSLEARDVLLKVLAQDGEPSVRAAAIEALGRIAWDADGASAAAIGRAVGVWPDPAKEPLALAAAGALESIALYEGVPPGPEGMRILISLVEGSWPGRVRSRAEAALQSVVRSSRPAEEFVR